MREKHFNIEECPLQNHNNCQKKPKTLKGPARVVKLCVLGIILPALLIAVPLYMRFHVYGSQLYPLAMSDMRMLDNKISTIWCQKQLVKVNTTFNAFLLPAAPALSTNLRELSMVRHLVLEDDMKEYWGFYLLQGSTVTVSACARWPGASLIVIRGHKHLHECAYIGDNSSEELDELMEAIREGSYNGKADQTGESTSKSIVNQPEMMRRHRVGVEFHHPQQQNASANYTINNVIDTSDVTDAKLMKTLLEALQEKVGKRKNISKSHGGTTKIMARNSTVAKDETGNVHIEAPNFTQTHSQEVYNDIIRKLEALGEKGSNILDKLNKNFVNKQKKSIDMKGRHYAKPTVTYDDNIDQVRRRRDLNLLHEDDRENDLGGEEGFTPKPDGIADHRGTINETTLNDFSNSEFWSSFSSSEEALLNCAGLILNLPLTPHHKCSPNLTEAEAEEAYISNTVSYTVPVNGYYFFVFNSENEVQPNYIRVKFKLKKSIYNISNPIANCTNSSSQCSMNLKFFSSEKLVMELPVSENDTLWNEEFVVVSECEPRTVIYAACVIAVPILVILFAFS